jgi:hypothetical protein
MLSRAIRALFLLIAMGSALLLAGCTTRSEWMNPVIGRSPLRASTTAAVVVFVRPSSYASGYLIPIIDENGRFLGEAGPKTRFAVLVPPGDHLFIGWRENTTLARARLLAGKTYYVEVSTKMGFLEPRVHLLAIAPRTKSWAKLPDWIAETEEMAPNLEAGQRALDQKHDDVQLRIHEAFEALQDFDERELEARTLHPEDGT